MKHERGINELLGQNGTSGGNQDSRQAFTQASLSTGITPHKDMEENRLNGKREAKDSKALCQHHPRFLCILLSSILCYPTEILLEDEGQ